MENNPTYKTLTSLQRNNLSQKMPNKISNFREEIKTVKQHLRMIDEAMKAHEWNDVSELLNEIATMSTELMVKAQENAIKRGM